MANVDGIIIVWEATSPPSMRLDHAIREEKVVGERIMAGEVMIDNNIRGSWQEISPWWLELLLYI